MMFSFSPFLKSLEFVLFVVSEVWSFCWCLNTKSLLAKQRPQAAHWNGFSLVWLLSCLFKCSSLAKALVHVVHTWGLGLSVLMMADFFGIGSNPWTDCWYCFKLLLFLLPLLLLLSPIGGDWEADTDPSESLLFKGEMLDATEGGVGIPNIRTTAAST